MFVSGVPRVESLKSYLLKELRQHYSYKQTKDLCEELAKEPLFSWAGWYLIHQKGTCMLITFSFR